MHAKSITPLFITFCNEKFRRHGGDREGDNKQLGFLQKNGSIVRADHLSLETLAIDFSVAGSG